MCTRVLFTACSPPSPTFPSPPNGLIRTTNVRCCSTRHGGGAENTAVPDWDSNAEPTVRSHRFRFDSDEDYDYEAPAFKYARQRRAWWSYDSVDTDEDDDDFEEYDDGLGVLEGSIGMPWIFKIFRAFGWMIPAITISALLGTGTNTFIMALGLPLAQSALSLVIDAVWGSSNDNPIPKTRPNKRPVARDPRNVRVNKRKEQNSWKKEGRENNQFSSAGRTNSSAVNFGGWDELDRQENRKAPKSATTMNSIGSKLIKSGKLSRRSRNRETPLLLRLLISVFPFLGSWTKIL